MHINGLHEGISTLFTYNNVGCEKIFMDILNISNRMNIKSGMGRHENVIFYSSGSTDIPYEQNLNIQLASMCLFNKFSRPDSLSTQGKKYREFFLQLKFLACFMFCELGNPGEFMLEWKSA